MVLDRASAPAKVCRAAPATRKAIPILWQATPTRATFELLALPGQGRGGWDHLPRRGTTAPPPRRPPRPRRRPPRRPPRCRHPSASRSDTSLAVCFSFWRVDVPRIYVSSICFFLRFKICKQKLKKYFLEVHRQCDVYSEFLLLLSALVHKITRQNNDILKPTQTILAS